MISFVVRTCSRSFWVCVEGKKVRVLDERSAVWLFQMSDEQRRKSRFFTLNPPGVWLFERRAALLLLTGNGPAASSRLALRSNNRTRKPKKILNRFFRSRLALRRQIKKGRLNAASENSLALAGLCCPLFSSLCN